MAMYIATLHIVVEANSQAEACDGIAETLRDLTMGHKPAIVDWAYMHIPGYCCPMDDSEYAGPIPLPDSVTFPGDVNLTEYAPR